MIGARFWLRVGALALVAGALAGGGLEHVGAAVWFAGLFAVGVAEIAQLAEKQGGPR